MRVAVLGSTGFLGEQILEVLAKVDDFEIVLLGGFKNTAKLIEQAELFNPRYVYSPFLSYDTSFPFRPLLSPDHLEEVLLSEEVEGVFFAVSGIAFLELFRKLLESGKALWGGSKEVVILLGDLEGEGLLLRYPNLIPLDSEHNALWQLFRAFPKEEVEKVYLTASGGPFYEWQGSWSDITPEMALAHPNWKMGAKITVDSANLVNKGLEVMEAFFLFGLPPEKIDVLIQRESCIHALVETKDGFVFAVFAPPDMHLVIQNAVSCQRGRNLFRRMDFREFKALHFDYPVPERFEGFYLALRALQKGRGYPTLFCGADEALVDRFLSREISFDEIPLLLEKVIERNIHPPRNVSESEHLFRLGFSVAEDLVRQRSTLG
jgi:1-deoxy-D-xylulose-5-phosphate reductoisomerase